MSMRLTTLTSPRMWMVKSNFSELDETSIIVSNTSQRHKLAQAKLKLFATVLMTLRMSWPALGLLASSKELESESSSETLIGSDLASSQPLNLELDWIWPRSPFPNKSSLSFVILTRHQKRVLTLNGENSAITLMKFSLRKVLRSLSIPKLD